MQVIWVSGPAAKVVTWSITARTVLLALATLSSGLVVLGFVFNLVGLRVAVEYAPELAQRMGGVTSQSEQEKMEAIYRSKLDKLNQQLSTVTDRVQELDSVKNEVLGKLGIEKLFSSSLPGLSNPLAGRGGPLNLLPMWGFSDKLNHQLDQSLKQMQQYDNAILDMQKRWQKDLDRIDSLPTVLPISGPFFLTSSFGVRADPITHMRSMHEGIDFVAPMGTPVLATADGVVLRAEHHGAYGNMVDVAHVDGFVTRYAHLKSIDVRAQDQVKRHDTLGTLGNTGRSTGPHLHYEVIFKGEAVHPVKALAVWSRKSSIFNH
jgi:murein DD-endopeptidase MepM/ murein hydrolase activator NlpD